MMDKALLSTARDIAKRLRKTDSRIVFAESCTAGLIAATMARVPGISAHLCGSAVVYRNETKSAWLNVSADDLANESIGPVSEEVADAMVIGVLQMTPEADFAASITGHLGPDAPDDLDGVVVVSIARRDPVRSSCQVIDTIRHRLTTTDSDDTTERSLRDVRQQEAALFVLQALATSLR